MRTFDGAVDWRDMHPKEYDINDTYYSCNDGCPFFDRAGYSTYGVCRRLTDWKRKLIKFVELDEAGENGTCLF